MFLLQSNKIQSSHNWTSVTKMLQVSFWGGITYTDVYIDTFPDFQAFNQALFKLVI